jgi:hypothetical protein
MPAPGPTPVQRSVAPGPPATPPGDALASAHDSADDSRVDDVRSGQAPVPVGQPAASTWAAPTPTLPAAVVPAPVVLRATAPPLPGPTASSAAPPGGSVPPPVLPLAVPPTPPQPPAQVEPIPLQTALDDGPPVAASRAIDQPDVPAAAAGAASGGGAQVPVQLQAATAAPAPAGAASGGSAPSGSATGDVDALAQRLFPAVLRRMKAELLLDRERRGVRTDPW